ncbi:MAG: diheme cytochrome c-553 [Acidobacteria bacterium]|nr:diheme cytochrome c-553 [Acidobacteriota bacterium]
MDRTAFAAFALASTLLAGAASAAGDKSPQQTKIERGRALVTLGGCNDCHTPLKMTPQGPAPDTARMLSGHPEQLQMPPAPALPAGPWGFVGAATMTAWSGPWGTSFVSNITPDPETGIGKWSEKDFVTSMRSGRHLGTGRAYLPPMPWQNLAASSDEDLSAIYAYLMSIPPVNNRVPDPIAPQTPAAH